LRARAPQSKEATGPEFDWELTHWRVVVEPFLVETLAPAFTMGTGVARAAEGIRINAHNEYRLFFNLGLSFRRSKWNFSRKIFGGRDGLRSDTQEQDHGRPPCLLSKHSYGFCKGRCDGEIVRG
jgi:hypothetical protein